MSNENCGDTIFSNKNFEDFSNNFVLSHLLFPNTEQTESKTLLNQKIIKKNRRFFANCSRSTMLNNCISKKNLKNDNFKNNIEKFDNDYYYLLNNNKLNWLTNINYCNNNEVENEYDCISNKTKHLVPVLSPNFNNLQNNLKLEEKKNFYDIETFDLTRNSTNSSPFLTTSPSSSGICSSANTTTTVIVDQNTKANENPTSPNLLFSSSSSTATITTPTIAETAATIFALPQLMDLTKNDKIKLEDFKNTDDSYLFFNNIFNFSDAVYHANKQQQSLIKFSIDNILHRKESKIENKPINKSCFIDSSFVMPKLDCSFPSTSISPNLLNEVYNQTTNVESTLSNSSNLTHDNVNRFPAWIFCTRYSDRPSSGSRTRKIKRKTEYQSNNVFSTSLNNKEVCNNIVEEEKRPRTAFTNEQLERLKQQFIDSRYLTEKRRQELAHELGLNESQIKIWFQNKRAKLKKSNNAATFTTQDISGTKAHKKFLSNLSTACVNSVVNSSLAAIQLMAAQQGLFSPTP